MKFILFCLSLLLGLPSCYALSEIAEVSTKPVDDWSLQTANKKLSVLILVSSSYGRPGIESFNRGVLDAWSELGQSTDTLSMHYLDMNRGADLGLKETLRDYILSRESGKHYDLVLLLQQDAVDFFLTELSSKVATGAPLLIAFAQVSEEQLSAHQRKAYTPRNALEIGSTLNVALKMFPKTERVVVVTGNADSDLSPVDSFFSSEEFNQFKERVHFERPKDLTLPQMRTFLSRLDDKTIVLRGSYGTDVTQSNLGKTPIELGIELSNASNAPNFVLYETAIGQAPVIGGEVQRLSDVGKQLVFEGVRHLHSKLSEKVLHELLMPSASVYDYKEILRHKGVFSAVPAGAKVLNAPPSIWQDYRKEVMIFTGFSCLLMLMISGLLLERRKKHKMAMQLAVSEKQLQAVVERAPHVAIQRYDESGRIIDWNPASTQMYGWKKSEVIGKYVQDLLGKSQAVISLERSIAAVKSGQSFPQYRKTIPTKDGQQKEILTTLFSIPGHDGSANYVSMDVDVSELKRHEESLSQLASVFAHASEGILITSLDGRVLSVNDALCKISGLSREDIERHHYVTLLSAITNDAYPLQHSIEESLQRQQNWSSEVEGQRKDGSPLCVMVNINAAVGPDSQVKHYVCLMSEITELKMKQLTLERLAHYDRLTDLPNRVLFSRQLLQSMSKVPSSASKLAVLYIDLDGFKQVNDQQGHETGDLLLVEIAKRMRATLRSHDTIARLGGDEFAAVLPDLFLQDDIHLVLERLIDAVSKPVLINGKELRVTASVGVCFYRGGVMDADQLLRQADQAMYIAKQSGKNRYKVFDSEQEMHLQARNDEISRLQQALLNREFELFYQPKVDVRRGVIIGVEALIRWRHPEKGIVPPGLFLPLIDNHPLSISLGDWVINEALRQAEIWDSKGLCIPVSVNVDGSQLAQDDFVEKLAASISNYPRLPLRRLELEILESSALDHVADIGAVIRRCASLGIQTSLDDFGTGYSTLSYLKELPVNTLKIDQSFIRNIVHHENQSDLAIIQAILGLAHGFGCNVVAEGVETMEHVQILSVLGCDQMQGYAFAKPMPAEDVELWVINWEASHTLSS